MTSIINYSDLLCAQTLTPEDANEYARIIHDKSIRLKNLTADLFDISKVQSGNERIELESLDLLLLLSQTLAELDDQMQDSALDFQIHLPEEPVMIVADGKKAFPGF